MRIYLALLMLLLCQGLYPTVKSIDKDAWELVIPVDKIHWNNTPLIFLLTDGHLTNTVFLLTVTNSNAIIFEAPEGNYRYFLYDRDKREIDKGELALFQAFKARLLKVKDDSATVLVNITNRLFLEIFIYKNTELSDYKRLLLTNHSLIDFGRLTPNAEYTLLIQGDGNTARVEFKTKKRNLALNRPITGTFNRLPESRFIDDSMPAITRINDGIIGWYSGMAASEEINLRDQVAIIDLLTVKKVRELRIIWHALYYPHRYRMVFSYDGRDWQTEERSRESYKKDIAPDNTPILLDEWLLDKECRYIGVEIEKDTAIETGHYLRNYVELLEIEAYE